MDPMPDFQPLYKQVYDVLVRRIAEGEWRPAEALPSEQALAAELKVSQGTVRKALDALVAENLVRRQQGKGTFLAEHTQEHALFRFFHLARPNTDGERTTPKSSEARCKRRTATAAEVDKLHLRKGESVVEIKRARLIDGVPAVSERIVVPLKLFPEIDHQDALPNTLYSLYQNVYGINIAIAKEELRAVTSNKNDERELGIAPGTPILRVDRIAVDIAGRRAEWRTSRFETRELVYAVDLN
ncbi:MAG: GntR family transcriptional regulator [Woeseiaceae bacterium]|nr:GntR family transcriptional regulator [Woeseiaceae bacterium]